MSRTLPPECAVRNPADRHQLRKQRASATSCADRSVEVGVSDFHYGGLFVHGIPGARIMITGYRLILASCVGERDGMAMELDRDDGRQVAEVFEDEDTRQRTVNLFEKDVPLEALEWLLSEAAEKL